MIKFQSSESFTVQFPSGHGYVNTVDVNLHEPLCRFCNYAKGYRKGKRDDKAEMQQSGCKCNEKGCLEGWYDHIEKKTK